MKKLTDKEIQDLFEKGETHQLGEEADLYRKVFTALKAEPEMKLSADFSNAVVNKVASKSSPVEKFLYGVCVFGGLSSIIVAVVLIKLFASPTVVAYLPYMGIGFVMIGLIQWLDKYSRRAYT